MKYLFICLSNILNDAFFLFLQFQYFYLIVSKFNSSAKNKPDSTTNKPPNFRTKDSSRGAWATSGNGVDLNQFLLQPLDQNAEAIINQEVLDGYEIDSDFEWNWFQHSPIILPNGNIMCFDNGSKRNFSTSPNYSRAVEYKINQEDMTVQQVWTYGKELGEEAYSHIVSKVCYITDSDHVIFAPGAISQNGPLHGRIYEVDKITNEVKLNMKITPPNAFIGVTFHNAQRFDLGRNN